MISGENFLGTARRFNAGEVPTAATPSQLSPSVGEKVQQQITKSLTAYPAATLVVAIAMGVMLGWLVKRR